MLKQRKVFPGSPTENNPEKTIYKCQSFPEINYGYKKEITGAEFPFLSAFPDINSHSFIKMEDVRKVLSACTFTLEVNYLGLRKIIVIITGL